MTALIDRDLVIDLASAHVTARCVHVVADLGVADALGEEPRTAEELALTVRADADALDRVLKNLISNALKYSPAGTCVRVRARRAPGVVAVDVEDEGPGVPPDDLERIFEPYYRVPATARIERGTGLGLAVVKSLVEAHGGRIRAERRDGCGTRMTFVLPAISPVVS
jgi:signal transduction histidine kinase